MIKYSDWPEDKKERARAAHRAWNSRNKKKRSEYYKEYDANRTAAEKLFRYMQGRKLPYTISVDDIIIPDNCPICGVLMRPSEKRGGDSQSPTLDKIVPEIGYVKGNIAVICKGCNSMKGKGSADDHRRIADYIDKHINSHPSISEVPSPCWRRL